MSVVVEVILPNKLYERMKIIEAKCKISVEEQIVTALVKYIEEVGSCGVG